MNKLNKFNNNHILKTILNNNSCNIYSNNIYYSTKSKKPILLGYEHQTAEQQQKQSQKQQSLTQANSKRIRNRSSKKQKKKELSEIEKEENEDDIDNSDKINGNKLNKEISNMENHSRIGSGGGILSKYQASNFIKNNWMKRHLTDEYVKEARTLGLVSRAAFKLININKQLRLLKPRMIVVDLGASPGSWTQVAKSEVTRDGLVVSVDMNDKFQLTSKASFIQGDFTLKETQDKVLELVRYKSISNLESALEKKRQLQLEKDLIEYSKNNNNNNINNINKQFDNNNNNDNDNDNDNNNNNSNNKNRLVDVILSDMAPYYSGIPKVDHSRLIELQTSALNFALKVLKKGGSFACKVSRGGEERQFFQLLEKYFATVKTMKPDASRLESSEIYYIGRGFIVPKNDELEQDQ